MGNSLKASWRNDDARAAQTSPQGEILSASNLKAFTLNDMKNTTGNFGSECCIGERGFGYVCKGWMDDQTLAPSKPGRGMVVAVKKLKLESFQGHKEWLVQRLTISVSFTIRMWLSSLATVWMMIIDFWSTNTWQKAAWRRTFSEDELSRSTGQQDSKSRLEQQGVSHFCMIPGFENLMQSFQTLASQKLDQLGIELMSLLRSWELKGTQLLNTSRQLRGGVVGDAIGALSTRQIEKRHRTESGGLGAALLGRQAQMIRNHGCEAQRAVPKRGANTLALLASKCIGNDAKLRPSLSQVLASLEELQDPKFAQPHRTKSAVAIPKSPSVTHYHSTPSNNLA
ncbi:hypothetical protein C4D60_Mb10t05290 [Musa balbisiana]|uniref:Protein kinase domain-containing protein n=1 Tax=Musa balbisiana TaxID=52838 RepID=A0A4S8IW63_MUSBA|nr:hypothetical protein C4D60_Mb10t05290 [Musa balbisiana]